MSSDLREHPVGYFALSLLENIDQSRFEVFIYSYNRGPTDALQTRIQMLVHQFRTWPDIAARDAAQAIADDRLDILIELGGSTYMNKLDVMAYRPAPIQASWLGYPHSSGLSTIDYYICDPHNAPTDPTLMIERLLQLPRSWIAMSPALFERAPVSDGDLPERRNGHITYGTANNPHKFNAELLAAWARITAATPGAHFAFIRPEAGSRAFRRHIEAVFAAHGVAADRLDWHVTRGNHMAAYGQIDISLDTFPLTGGTTTVESLLMGVPVVSLAGEAMFERLSRSIMINAGLEDLCADSMGEFEAAALRLAADPARRQELRSSLRSRLEASPLGQPTAFARDFLDMVYATVRSTVA